MGAEDTDGSAGSTGNKDADADDSAQWAAQLIALRPVPVPPVVQEYGTNTTTDMAKWVVVGLTGTGAGARINESYLSGTALNTSSGIVKAINCVTNSNLSSTGTNLSTPMEMARVYLQTYGRPGVKKGIIFETDGAPNHTNTPDPPNYTCAARASADRARAVTSLWNLSSNQAASLRASARVAGLFGNSGGSGWVSSRYSKIAVEFASTRSLIRSTGTCPAGFMRRKSIRRSQGRSSTSSTSIFFSASTRRNLAAEGGQRLIVEAAHFVPFVFCSMLLHRSFTQLFQLPTAPQTQLIVFGPPPPPLLAGCDHGREQATAGAPARRPGRAAGHPLRSGSK